MDFLLEDIDNSVDDVANRFVFDFACVYTGVASVCCPGTTDLVGVDINAVEGITCTRARHRIIAFDALLETEATLAFEYLICSDLVLFMAIFVWCEYSRFYKRDVYYYKLLGKWYR